MRTIRASEIGVYLYCQRAWWYARSGMPSENVSEMASGSEIHARHGRSVLGVSCLQVLGYALLLLALIIIVAHFTGYLV